MDLVLELVPAEVKGYQELLVFANKVVEDARNDVFLRDVLEAECKLLIRKGLVLHGQVGVEGLLLLVRGDNE